MSRPCAITHATASAATLTPRASASLRKDSTKARLWSSASPLKREETARKSRPLDRSFVQ